MTNHVLRLVRDEAGQDLPEYAILIGLVALAVVVSVALLGTSISDTFDAVGSTISSADIASSS